MSRARVRALRALRDPRSYGESETAELDRHLSKSLDPNDLGGSDDEEPSYDSELAHQVAYHDPKINRALDRLDRDVGRSMNRLTGGRPETHPGDAYGEDETADLDKRLKKTLNPRRLAVK